MEGIRLHVRLIPVPGCPSVPFKLPPFKCIAELGPREAEAILTRQSGQVLADETHVNSPQASGLGQIKPYLLRLGGKTPDLGKEG